MHKEALIWCAPLPIYSIFENILVNYNQHFIPSSKENIIDVIVNKINRLAKITFFNLFLNKKIKNNPSKNKINGILFPEKIMAVPKMHIEMIINIGIKNFLSL